MKAIFIDKLKNQNLVLKIMEDIPEKLRAELANEIKKDLCQQYSVNENHRQTIIFTLLGVLISGITAYGITLSNYLKTTDCISLLLFILASCFSIFLFVIPVVFSIINGYTLRRDQLIVNKIRKDSFKDEFKKIFCIYDHSIKSHFCFLQDFNLAVVLFSIILQILLFFTTACIVMIINLTEMKCCFFSQCCGVIKCYFVVVQIYAFIYIIFTEILIFTYYANKYKRKRKLY
ncbi:MAG: hypothetical protein WCL51_15180 [Bacteroidota bacterium]